MKLNYRALLAAAALAAFPLAAGAAAITLGTAANFAVLAGTAVTDTGTTTLVGGALGVSPGSTVTGFPAVPPFAVHAGDGVAATAHADLVTAYGAAAALSPSIDLSGTDLGTLAAPLTPGVYSFSAAAALTGTLALDTLGDPTAQFVFQIADAFTTAAGSSVTTTGGGNVFWQVGAAATLGAGSSFRGHLLASQSITLGDGAAITGGSALAIDGAVTLSNNTIDNRAPAAPAGVVPLPTTAATGSAALAVGLLLGRTRRPSPAAPPDESQPPQVL